MGATNCYILNEDIEQRGGPGEVRSYWSKGCPTWSPSRRSQSARRPLCPAPADDDADASPGSGVTTSPCGVACITQITDSDESMPGREDLGSVRNGLGV